MNSKFSTGKAQNILMQMLYHGLTQPIVYKTPFSINNILIMDENLYEELIQYLETLTYWNGLDDKWKTHIRKISTQHFVKNHTLYRQSKAGNVRVITRQQVEPILYNLHQDLTGAYLGTDAVFEKIKERYYWPQMFE